MSGDVPQATGRFFRFGRYRFEHQPDGRWGASNGSLGTSGARTPFGAACRLWRLIRGGYQGPPQ